MTEERKIVLRNLAILIFGALPLAILSSWLASSLFPLDWMRETERGSSVGGQASGFLFWFLILFVPVLIGGLIHQIALGAIPSSWKGVHRRLAILFSAAVIPLGFILIGNRPGALLMPRALLPIMIGLMFYGALARPLPPRDL